ncbi:alpha/beta fold hydrolase [Streptomyces sp. NPDC088354]|uniref:alpha/beta fold hydrolase n=1 Tax=Streptomyces sp. NPDC088354 TaxID=3365856 RepID=UPI00381D25A1
MIALDHRGHGRSERPAHGYRVSRLAMDLHDLCDAALLGHSLGCAALWCHRDLFGRDRTGRLVLVDRSPVVASQLAGAGQEPPPPRCSPRNWPSASRRGRAAAPPPRPPPRGPSPTCCTARPSTRTTCGGSWSRTGCFRRATRPTRTWTTTATTGKTSCPASPSRPSSSAASSAFSRPARPSGSPPSSPGRAHTCSPRRRPAAT